MKIYQVGGSVRDELLDREIKDRDWVVVGATPDDLTSQGYQQVGKDFPVFLHPQTKEEYALARTERKTAPGYSGFSFDTSASITLEQDLLRRDLTINAIAKSENGKLIDPYNGKQDLEQRILRHVSPAFAEDPVRILRVARFAARFAEYNFTIADETMQLMRDMVNNGEVDALVAERVWQELNNALAENKPSIFFEVLRECGALAKLFPEIDRLFGVPQPEQHHPEVDTGIHTMMVLDQAVKLSNDTKVRFAALVHDLGKGTTPEAEWPKHIAHESRGVPLVKELCARIKVPRDYCELAVLVTEHHLEFHRIKELKPQTVLKKLQQLDAFRRPERFELFLLACEADARGRPGYETRIMQQPALFRAYMQAASSVDTKSVISDDKTGEQIAQAIYNLRLDAIRQVVPLNETE